MILNFAKPVVPEPEEQLPSYREEEIEPKVAELKMTSTQRYTPKS